MGHPRWYAYAVTLHTLCILFLAAVVSTAHHVVILLNVSLPSDFSLPLAAGAYDGSSAVFQWSGDGCSLIAEVWEENAYCGGECAHRYVPVVIGMRFLFKVQRMSQGSLFRATMCCIPYTMPVSMLHVPVFTAECVLRI